MEDDGNLFITELFWESKTAATENKLSEEQSETNTIAQAQKLCQEK